MPQLTYYAFDTNGNVLYEQENSGYLEYVYVLGKHFARVDGSLSDSTTKKYFYQTDHLGSTVLVTDESGGQVWSAEYTPFGKQTAADGELEHAAKFTGKDLDGDTGLYYFNARWYDQEIGRFVEEDPIQGEWIGYLDKKSRLQTDKLLKVALGNEDDKAKSFEESAIEDSNIHKINITDRTNWYCYCNNNPINFVDPDGFNVFGHSWGTAVYAKIANNVYNGKVGDVISGGGVKLIEVHQFLNSKIGVYAKMNSDGKMEYAIANRGSGLQRPLDWINNITSVFGLSFNEWYSEAFARRFVKEHPYAYITFVGHSKGGAEAAYNAMATNRDAVIFNPAPVNPVMYGLKSSNAGAINEYIVKGEILNDVFFLVPKPTHNVTYLPMQALTPVGNHGMPSVYKALGISQ